jgi:nucleoid DNA-binding protein
VLLEKNTYICVNAKQMNFSEFHKDLSKEFGYSTRESKKIVSFLQKLLRKKLMFGVEVSLREIGTFVRRVRHPKPYLNLKTNKMEMSQRIFVLKLRTTRKMADDLKKKTVYGYSQSQRQENDKE